MVRAVVGANWGDEGKGKLVDHFAAHSDYVVRYQGGSNAGHSIRNEYGKFALHLLPSGVFYQHTTNVIGNGVALDIAKLQKEVEALVAQGVPAPKLKVSDRAQVVTSLHVRMDKLEEQRLSDRKFGSTQSGIAPFYGDKFMKIGIQVNELFDDDTLRARVEHLCTLKNALITSLYHEEPVDPNALYAELVQQRAWVKPYVCNTFDLLSTAATRGENILLEGQLGSLRDPDMGIYPFTTSSSTLAGYASSGCGIAPYQMKEIIAVVKAYSSAVGAGAFVSELFGEEADTLRMRGGDGGEFGATTGRPRRVGWLDLVASRYGCQVQGATHVAFTVIDVLGYLDQLPVCVAYEINGKKIDAFPNTTLLNQAKPVYEVLPGWKSDVSGITKYDELPSRCRDYIEFAQKHIGVPIAFVSNGPSREELIIR